MVHKQFVYALMLEMLEYSLNKTDVNGFKGYVPVPVC